MTGSSAQGCGFREKLDRREEALARMERAEQSVKIAKRHLMEAQEGFDVAWEEMRSATVAWREAR